MRGGSFEAAREVFAGFDGALGSGFTGDVEVEWWPFAASGSFLAVNMSASAPKGRFEDVVDAEDERDDFNRVGFRDGEIEGPPDSSCLIVATRVLLSSWASSPSTDFSRLTVTGAPSSKDDRLEESLLRRPILIITLLYLRLQKTIWL